MSDNAAGFAALDAHIERVRGVPDALDDHVSVLVGEVETEMHRQIAAGQSPEGRPWQPKAGGGKPLDGAEKSLGVAAVGRRIIIRAWGHIARHSRGRAKGGIERRVVPVGSIPERLGTVLRESLEKKFAKHMGGES